MHPWMIYNSCLDERAEQMRAPCYESLVWCFLFLFVIVDGAEGRFCSPSFLLEHASVGKYGHFKARRRRNRNARQLRGWEPGSSREVKTRKGARIHIRGGKKKMMLQRNWGTCSLPVPTDCLDGPLRGALLFPAHLFPHPKRLLLLLLLKTPHFFAPFVWHITTLHYLRPWCWLNHLAGGNPAKRINIYFSLTSAVDGTHLNLPEIAIKH